MVDTGLYVYAGDLVRFQATGTVYMMEGEGDPADPGGSRTGRRAADSPIPSQPAGALIARVEQGAPFSSVRSRARSACRAAVDCS